MELPPLPERQTRPFTPPPPVRTPLTIQGRGLSTTDDSSTSPLLQEESEGCECLFYFCFCFRFGWPCSACFASPGLAAARPRPIPPASPSLLCDAWLGSARSLLRMIHKSRIVQSEPQGVMLNTIILISLSLLSDPSFRPSLFLCLGSSSRVGLGLTDIGTSSPQESLVNRLDRFCGWIGYSTEEEWSWEYAWWFCNTLSSFVFRHSWIRSHPVMVQLLSLCMSRSDGQYRILRVLSYTEMTCISTRTINYTATYLLTRLPSTYRVYLVSSCPWILHPPTHSFRITGKHPIRGEMSRRSPERDRSYAVSSSYKPRPRPTTSRREEEATPEPGQISSGHGRPSHPSLPLRREWEVEKDPRVPPSVGVASGSGSGSGSRRPRSRSRSRSRGRDVLTSKDKDKGRARGRSHTSSRSRSRSRDRTRNRDRDTGRYEGGGRGRESLPSGNGYGWTQGRRESPLFNKGEEVTAALDAFLK